MSVLGVGVSFVLYHEAPAVLSRALRALESAGEAVGRVAIVINDSAPGEREDIEELVLGRPWPVDVHATRANLGYAGGHNANLARLFAGGVEAVLVLNADVILAPGSLACLRAEARQRSERALLGPVLELAGPEGDGLGLIDTVGIRWTRDGRHLDDLQGRPLAAAPTEPRCVPGLSGACLLVTRASYDIICSATGEFFDEDFLAYREDAELGLRAAALGIPSVVVPASRGRHGRRLRGTARGRDVAIDRLGVQNRFLIAFTHGRHRPGLLPLVLARDALVVVAVLTRERTSIPGLRRAWTLRHRARAKGRAVWSSSAVGP